MGPIVCPSPQCVSVDDKVRDHLASVARVEYNWGNSVIGKDTQYTLSEATKTLDLGDTSKAGEEADSLWMGCATFGSSEGLCEVRPRGYAFSIVLKCVEHRQVTRHPGQACLLHGSGSQQGQTLPR